MMGVIGITLDFDGKCPRLEIKIHQESKLPTFKYANTSRKAVLTTMISHF
jgi:hypothetical protein